MLGQRRIADFGPTSHGDVAPTSLCQRLANIQNGGQYLFAKFS
jgi:hypothetical protein